MKEGLRVAAMAMLCMLCGESFAANANANANAAAAQP
jgi:hypothetical protein